MKGPLFQLSYITDEIWSPRSRFERTTISVQGSCSTRLSYEGMFGVDCLGVASGARTRNHRGHIPGLWPD